MLIEIAIGDAYGAGFEYASDKLVREQNDLSRYVQHPRHAIKPGCYTDDTQMSIAIVEAMLAGFKWTPELLADRFVNAFKRDPREGYASAFHQLLTEIRDGDEFLARIRPNSEKSGAAMRAGPIGLYPTIQDVLKQAARQAALTHDTPLGIRAAQAAALMTHYCRFQLGPKNQLGKFLEEHVPGEPWSFPWTGKVDHLGVMSVRAAVTALQASDRMTDLLRACIAFTGDVDTVASIALAAGSTSRDIEQDLPQHLHDGLERGPYGYDFLKELDERLLSRSGFLA
jgi:ADP-ribosyl-[dinitrogen reductase] hydrolase